MATASPRHHCRSRAIGAIVLAIALLVLYTETPAAAANKVHQVTLIMKEFLFEPATVQLKVGEEVALTIRNVGKVKHEWSAGQDVVTGQDEKGYRKDLVAILKPRVTGKAYDLEKVSATKSNEAKEGETTKGLSSEIDVEPGGVATLHFKVPASAKGEWGMGCFIPGHYESGMKGTLVIK